MRRTKEETFELIYSRVEDRLNVLGLIATKDAWHLTRMDYGLTSHYFRQIMATMVEQGKAVPVKNGCWKIIKPNDKNK